MISDYYIDIVCVCWYVCLELANSGSKDISQVCLYGQLQFCRPHNITSVSQKDSTGVPTLSNNNHDFISSLLEVGMLVSLHQFPNFPMGLGNPLYY